MTPMFDVAASSHPHLSATMKGDIPCSLSGAGPEPRFEEMDSG
jgi:hypothetical protein